MGEFEAQITRVYLFGNSPRNIPTTAAFVRIPGLGVFFAER